MTDRKKCLFWAILILTNMLRIDVIALNCKGSRQLSVTSSPYCLTDSAATIPAAIQTCLLEAKDDGVTSSCATSCMVVHIQVTGDLFQHKVWSFLGCFNSEMPVFICIHRPSPTAGTTSTVTTPVMNTTPELITDYKNATTLEYSTPEFSTEQQGFTTEDYATPEFSTEQQGFTTEDYSKPEFSTEQEDFTTEDFATPDISTEQEDFTTEDFATPDISTEQEDFTTEDYTTPDTYTEQGYFTTEDYTIPDISTVQEELTTTYYPTTESITEQPEITTKDASSHENTICLNGVLRIPQRTCQHGALDFELYDSFSNTTYKAKATVSNCCSNSDDCASASGNERLYTCNRGEGNNTVSKLCLNTGCFTLSVKDNNGTTKYQHGCLSDLNLEQSSFSLVKDCSPTYQDGQCISSTATSNEECLACCLTRNCNNFDSRDEILNAGKSTTPANGTTRHNASTLSSFLIVLLCFFITKLGL